MPDTGDSYNQIIGNFIENITGSYALNTSSGAGIYVSGAGIGGTVISGNIDPQLLHQYGERYPMPPRPSVYAGGNAQAPASQ